MQPRRQRVRSPPLHVVREWRKRVQPVEPPQDGCDPERDECGDGKRKMVDAPAGCAGLERTQRQQEQRHPLHEYGESPGDACTSGRAAVAERQCDGHERDHERIVVTTAGEVNGDNRVPADEGRRRSPPAGCEERREQNGEHGCDTERPPGHGRRARQADGLRQQRECRAVRRRRVQVGAARMRRRHGIVGRRLAVRVVQARVAPVGQRVGREQKRRSERGELDRTRDREHEAEAPATAKQPVADHVRRERPCKQDEKDGADVREPRDEHAGDDERQGEAAGDERASNAGSAPCWREAAPGWW